MTGNVGNKSHTHFCPLAYIEYNLLTFTGEPFANQMSPGLTFQNHFYPPTDINNSHWATIMGIFKLTLTEGLTTYNPKPLFPALAPTATAIPTSIPEPIQTGNQWLTVRAVLKLQLSKKMCLSKRCGMLKQHSQAADFEDSVSTTTVPV